MFIFLVVIVKGLKICEELQQHEWYFFSGLQCTV